MKLSSNPLAGQLVALFAIGFLMVVAPGWADPFPPPPPGVEIPQVFCFRVTDIAAVAGDPEGDRFTFEIEILNWTNRETFDLYFALNPGTGFPGPPVQQAPFFAGASVDLNGRPLGAGDDDLNFPPNDGHPGSKTGQPNGWGVSLQTITAVRYAEPTGTPGNGLAFRDLLGAATTAEACSLVPDCEIVNGSPVVPWPETIDNGAPMVDKLDDNVLDGFVIDVDDFDPGEMLSFDWFFTDAAGGPIGVSGIGNAFGFGTYNIYRVNSHGPPVWRRIPGVPEGPGSNTGTTNDLRDMFVDSTATGESFEVELGSALTPPFLNPADNVFDAPISAELIVDEVVIDVPTLSPWGLMILALLLVLASILLFRTWSKQSVS
jgi:hypothetical protein